jgi:hypothetical protein
VSAARRREPPSGRPERLLPFACFVCAAILLASERMTTFQLVAGPATSGASLCNLEAADRHHYALAVLGCFAIVAVVAAVLGGSKPAAIAVAVAGALALLLFLIVDLPKANNVGSISASCDLADRGFEARAQPQAGFWLELVGALGLTLSGAALATLNAEQLRALRPRWLGGGRAPKAPPDTPSARAD